MSMAKLMGENSCNIFKTSLICMKNCILVFVTCFHSCSTIPKIKDSEINPITNKFSGVYNNTPYVFRSNYRLTKYDSAKTLLQLLDTSKKHREMDSVQISFDSKGQLQLSDRDTSIFKPVLIKGRFSKKGYYEIYFSNKKIEIPPVIHFLFSSHNIKRIRIYNTKDNELIIYYYHYDSGNFLLVGGEGPRKTQFFFGK